MVYVTVIVAVFIITVNVIAVEVFVIGQLQLVPPLLFRYWCSDVQSFFAICNECCPMCTRPSLRRCVGQWIILKTSQGLCPVAIYSETAYEKVTYWSGTVYEHVISWSETAQRPDADRGLSVPSFQTNLASTHASMQECHVLTFLSLYRFEQDFKESLVYQSLYNLMFSQLHA